MHTHMSLFTDSRNQFFDGGDPHHSPRRGVHRGLLRHARELSAVFAQWVNSYKRLVPGFEAPVYVAWSQRNRSALIRIPLYKPGSEQATRAEIRCPTRPATRTSPSPPSARGWRIEQGYELEEPWTRTSILSAAERQERGIVALPGTWARRSRRSRVGADAEALGDHIHERYVEIKRREWDDYRIQLTQWGLAYLAVL
jgi:glutamine synthetase